MDPLEWPYRLRTARKKTRLVKKDFDKQLINLSKKQSELWKQRRNLPMIPLEHPYQKGWKRLFVLRDDVQKLPNADFYQTLLDKINTVKYYHDKSFKIKRRRKRRYGHKNIGQTLTEISVYDWYRNRYKLSDDEQACFIRTESMSVSSRYVDVRYVYAEPWRFVLKVMPHIIYEVQLHDEVLEQEMAALNNYIERNNLWHRINRLTNGRRYHGWDYIEKPKYYNELKNIPRYANKEAYLD